MRLSASSCEQGVSHSLSIGCRQIPCLSRVQMTCLSVEIVTISLLRNANSSLSLVLVDSEKPCPIFSELHYWAPIGDEFLSLSCPAFALSMNLTCSRPTQRRLSVLYPADALRAEGTHPGHIPGKFWLLLASA